VVCNGCVIGGLALFRLEVPLIPRPRRTPQQASIDNNIEIRCPATRFLSPFMGVGLAPNVKRGYAHDPHYGLRRQQKWSHCLRTYTERCRVLGEALRRQVQAGRFSCRSIPDRPSDLGALQVAARLEAGQASTF
jgi:hypothetical protein